jgi:acyl carrier protein
MNSVPNRAEILERLRKIVLNRVDVDPALLQPDAKLVEIGIDSFSLIELVFLAEEEFRVNIPVEELEVTTVSDVLTVIEKRFASVST